MNYIVILILVIANPLYAENIPGEWIGEIGLSESPVLDGNVFANPATADTLDFISVSTRFSFDDYELFNATLSSVTLSMPTFYGCLVGGRVNVLYDSKLDGEINLSNEWDSYTEYFTRRGGIDQYSFFLKKSFAPFSLGFDINLLNGKIEDKWKIVFDEYSDIFDTLPTYFRGYSAGIGIVYHLKDFRVGGYYVFYQNLKYWRDGEDKDEFNLERRASLGLSYSFDKGKSIMLSADKKGALLTGRYGPIVIGYGRIYGSGYELDIEGNRFMGGIVLSLNKAPIMITLENRRYLGEFSDNEYIGTISISITGEEGGR
ncbi:MAG: hypothetical protein E3J23_00685 [Candidatus Stahlbacteria bacterium]|nr:MAG: hypothetical protein E3J23_00685 [Candidatus Stahlbacteria bacterium]